VGLVTEGRQPPRTGTPVLVAGEIVGELTSGNYSPVLGHGIALALLPTATADGLDAVELDLRGRRVAARVVPLPFVAKQKG
jgi:aminomethyltransferase